jgi:hypothetical protein
MAYAKAIYELKMSVSMSLNVFDPPFLNLLISFDFQNFNLIFFAKKVYEQC